jgi:hypothetical protein
MSKYQNICHINALYKSHRAPQLRDFASLTHTGERSILSFDSKQDIEPVSTPQRPSHPVPHTPSFPHRPSNIALTTQSQHSQNQKNFHP